MKTHCHHCLISLDSEKDHLIIGTLRASYKVETYCSPECMCAVAFAGRSDEEMAKAVTVLRRLHAV